MSTTNADGSFELDNLRDKEYRLGALLNHTDKQVLERARAVLRQIRGR